MKTAISLFAALLLLAITIVITGCSSGSGAGNSGGIVQRQQTLQSSNLVNGIISVKAGSYYDTRFSVNGSGTVTGSFSARAALGDNIEVYILSDLAFQNWSHGSSYPNGTFYNSGRITTDNLNVTLVSGTYHLVFSNTYSMISTKQVTANINLNWYQ